MAAAAETAELFCEIGSCRRAGEPPPCLATRSLAMNLALSLLTLGFAIVMGIPIFGPSLLAAL